MWPYSHTPFAKPAAHVHRYACGDTPDPAAVDDNDDDDWLHVAPFWHGALAHSSTSTSQLPDSDASSSLSRTAHSLL